VTNTGTILRTSESGGTTTFSVSLANLGNADNVPTADVLVPLQVMQTGNPARFEGLIATPDQPTPNQIQYLIFSPNVDPSDPNYYANPHTVTVIGQDDNVFDGDQPYQIRVGQSTGTSSVTIESDDPEYENLPQTRTLQLINTDNEQNTSGDQPGFTFNPAAVNGTVGGLTTSEDGRVAVFTLRLNDQPTDPVTVTLTTSDPSEGRILLLNGQPFNQAADPVNSVQITFVPDPNFVADPNNPADRGVSSYTTPQEITVQGQDDTFLDGNIPYRIITSQSSNDPVYNAIDPPDVNISNLDNESLVTVNPRILVIEEGQSKTFSVVLNRRPNSDVTINLRVVSPDNDPNTNPDPPTTEGNINRFRLTFTPENYNVPQLVTVTTRDDALDDLDAGFRVELLPVISTDLNYGGGPGGTPPQVDPQDVDVINLNNDIAGISITPTSLTTTENQNDANPSFTVQLNTPPSAPVSITLDAGSTNTEGSLSRFAAPTAAQMVQTLTLTFTPNNFGPQTVYVIGKDDLVDDNNVTYTIITSAATTTDPKYSTVNPPDITVTNVDNEEPGADFSPRELITTEDRTDLRNRANFTARLTSPPASNVVLRLEIIGDDQTEALFAIPGSATPGATRFLTFTPANFNTPQTVTVIGQDDTIIDGGVRYRIVTTFTSGPTNYLNRNPVDVFGTNLDNDLPGFIIQPTTATRQLNGRLVTTEAQTNPGNSAAFTVRLATQPTTGISFVLRTSRMGEGLLIGSSGARQTSRVVSFTPNNWNVPQTITIVGVDDAVDDGDVLYTIVTDPATSSAPGGGDPNYAGKNPPDVQAINLDNDTAGAIVIPQTATSSGRLVTTESPSDPRNRASFNVRLATMPSGNVTYVFRTSNAAEGVLLSTGGVRQTYRIIQFTTADWFRPQTVVVAGVDDVQDDGDVNYTIVSDAALSNDLQYRGARPSVAVVNIDNDDVSTLGPTTYVAGQEYLIAIPYADTTDPRATTTPARAFTVPPTDANGVRNYFLYRYNPQTQQFESLGNNDLIGPAPNRRAEGYRIVVLRGSVSLKTPATDPTRLPMKDPGAGGPVTEYQVTLRRNPSSADGTNGLNLIGNPFDPAQFRVVDWLNSEVIVESTGQRFTTVQAAADAGILDPRLFSRDPGTGNFIGSGRNTIGTYQSFFVRTFVDGVKVNLRAGP